MEAGEAVQMTRKVDDFRDENGLLPCYCFGPDDPIESLPDGLLLSLTWSGNQAASDELDRRARLELAGLPPHEWWKWKRLDETDVATDELAVDGPLDARRYTYTRRFADGLVASSVTTDEQGTVLTTVLTVKPASGGVPDDERKLEDGLRQAADYPGQVSEYVASLTDYERQDWLDSHPDGLRGLGRSQP